MGSLRAEDEDGWRVGLSEARLADLREWMEDERYDLAHLGWFTDGRSGEPVAQVMRLGDDTEQLVLKFFTSDGPKRINKLNNAWKDARGRFTHLAAPEDTRITVGDWHGVYLRVAGGNLRSVVPLGSRAHDHHFPDYCATIVRSVVHGWNQGKLMSDDKWEVGSFLNELAARRWDGSVRWAQGYGVDCGESARQELPGFSLKEKANPFALFNGVIARRRVDPVFAGRAHGDLSGRNILVPTDPSVDAARYILIDYDRWAPNAPLARDPMHLLVALTLDHLDTWKQDLWPGIAKALVHPTRTDGLPAAIKSQCELSLAIHTASVPDDSKGVGMEWRLQCLLSLVGAGVVHLGRTLHVPDPAAAKRWCFDLAAMAAAAFMEEMPAETINTRRGEVNRPMPDADLPASPGLVDRHEDRRGLLATLASDACGVRLLHGVRGIGKTRLVDAVLADLAASRPGADSRRIAHHDARFHTLDVATFVDHIEGARDPLRPVGKSSLVRLEHALGGTARHPAVVVVDSAEHILHPTTGELLDPDLDEALEMVATTANHHVVVLLVMRHLARHSNRTWPGLGRPQYLEGLPEADFIQYLTRFDHVVNWEPAALPENTRRVLFAKVQGNPQLGRLAYAVVAADGGINLPTLVADLAEIEPAEMRDHLTYELIQRLGAVSRRVFHALAALGTPVPLDTLLQMVDDPAPSEVTAAVAELFDRGVVLRSTTTGHFYLPEGDRELVLDELHRDGQGSLFFKAAKCLMRLRHGRPGDIADLRIHFAELQALLAADEYESAAWMCERIDTFLRAWNCTHLLLEQREALRGKLDAHEEKVNLNALAYIYQCRGDLSKAGEALGQALKLAEAPVDKLNLLKIRINLAGLCWDLNEVSRALAQYEFGRDLAEEQNDPLALMTALEGIADCNRRWGHYGTAIENGIGALEIPQRADFPETSDAQSHADLRVTVIALKVSRWFSELGDSAEAARYDELARVTAGGRAEAPLRAAWLDGHADGLLARGEADRAVQAALEAVDHALTRRDSVVLMQARTTLCFAYLELGNDRQARIEAKLALPYRRKYRSLVVLALAALTAHRTKSSKAVKLFKDLLDESTVRTRVEDSDFGAWEHLGFALCGLSGSGGHGLDEAMKAFRKARDLTPGAPVVRARLHRMIVMLDLPGARTVLDVL
ncbi:hypothetical protein [Actinokineospora globicatena]|uniref:Tetratricopeptide repeat-containing protein n=1 Tax=Actinokineospora globicatena TaxID=103729 RepID=A0A9W6V6I3_9PSEU|nr:hypothetical protein [Actinokineospora globicatena]GLW90407.1 hypothetical protein Aglo03_12230 [Actinokineospora globicatena]